MRRWLKSADSSFEWDKSRGILVRKRGDVEKRRGIFVHPHKDSSLSVMVVSLLYVYTEKSIMNSWSINGKLQSTNVIKEATMLSWFRKGKKNEEGGTRNDRPPEGDCCPICSNEFHVPCRNNCGHWFCGKFLSLHSFLSLLLFSISTLIEEIGIPNFRVSVCLLPFSKQS